MWYTHFSQSSNPYGICFLLIYLHTRNFFSKATKTQRATYNMFFAPSAHIPKTCFLNQSPRESSGEEQEILPPFHSGSWRISYSGRHRNESILHARCLIAVLLPRFIQIPLEHKCQATMLLPSVPPAIKLVKSRCSYQFCRWCMRQSSPAPSLTAFLALQGCQVEKK